jgi:cytochrome c oxidase subunit I+III
MVLAEQEGSVAPESDGKMELAREKPVLDVSGLPTVVFGHRNVAWLGTVLFMTIEGAMVAMVVASYFYLRTRSSDWPPGVMPPALKWGMINLVVFVGSVAPAWWIKRASRARDLPQARLGLIVLTLFAALNILFRVFEFASLNVQWYANAYASTIWTMLGVHSGHLVTEFIDTIVLLALAFTGRVDGTRFANFDENSDYWFFVVGVAVISDIVIYGASRWL